MTETRFPNGLKGGHNNDLDFISEGEIRLAPATNVYIQGSNLVFEGATADAFETTIAVTDPTADRTLTLPDASGTLARTADITLLETLTSLSLQSNILSYFDEDGVETQIDLSLYLDDTNLARLTSGSLDGSTGIVTFTRDDASTFTIDMSALLDADTLASVTARGNSTTTDIVLTGTSFSTTLTKTDPTADRTITFPDLTGTVMLNVVEDTTPQLGGDLESNGNNILFADNDKAIFGASNDLEIYHFGNTYINNNNTSDLTIRNSANDYDVKIQSDNGSGGIANYFVADGSTGAAELHWGDYSTNSGADGGVKLTTQAGGIDVTGDVNIDGGDVLFEGTSFTTTLTYTEPTAAQTITLPDATGTVVLTQDLAPYLTAESDTLDSVTTRGNTTTNDITVGDVTAGLATVTSLDITGTGTVTFTAAGDIVLDAASGVANVDVSTSKIVNLGTPTANTDAATKLYVDNAVSSFSTTLSGLTDTTITNPTNGQALVYDSGSWINSTPVTTLVGLNDTNISAPADQHTLVYDFATSKWVNGLPTTYTGSRGYTGSQGTAGTSVSIIGSVADVNVNPPSDPQQTLNTAFPGAIDGNGVIDEITGDLWVLSSSTWNNVGRIVGYTGSQGVASVTDLTTTTQGDLNVDLTYTSATGNIAVTSGNAYGLSTTSTPQFRQLYLEDSTTGGYLRIRNTESNPQTLALIGTLEFSGKNDLGNYQNYAQILGMAEDYTNAAEDGRIALQVLQGSSLVSAIDARGDTGEILLGFDTRLNTGKNLIFEGDTADAFETILTVTDPTADRIIILPDATGTVMLNVVEDTSPQLGGQLDVQSNSITSSTQNFVAISSKDLQLDLTRAIDFKRNNNVYTTLTHDATVNDPSNTVYLPKETGIIPTIGISDNTLKLTETTNTNTSLQAIQFEGTNFTTTLDRTDATAARTITLPDASGTVALTSQLPTDTNTTYDLSVPASTTAIRLAGSDATNDDVTITGGTNVTVTRTSATELTISSTDTNTDTLQTIINDTSNNDRYITFVNNATGAQTGGSNSALRFNPSTGLLSVTELDVTGTGTYTFTSSSDINMDANSGLGIVNITGGLMVSAETTLASAIVSDLTSGRVTYAGTSGALVDSANLTFSGTTLTTADLVVSGNLTVSGTTTTVNSNRVDIGDNIITLNIDETGTPSQNAGIEIERGTSANVLLIWDESTDRWTFTNDGSTYYNIPLPSEYNTYTLPLATSTVRGGVKIGYTENGKNYPVELSNEQMFVNVPWTDTVYTLPAATSTVRGGIELFNDTVQTTAANSVTTTASRTYGIQVNSDGQAVVNVPWSDTNTDTLGFNIVGASATATANATATNTNVHINHIEGTSTVKSAHKISGAGATTVTSDASGNITITSTDTNTDTNTTYDLSVPASTTAIRLAGSDATNDDVTITGGTNVTVTRTSATELTISSTDTNTNQLTTFTLTADSGTNQTIAHNSTLDIAGGTYVSTVVGATDTVTVNHDNTTRSDTTSAASPNHGATFTAVDSVTTNATGHLTAINVKTVTLPADNNTDTLQTIANSTVNADRYITMTENATGAQEGISNAGILFNTNTQKLTVGGDIACAALITDDFTMSGTGSVDFASGANITMDCNSGAGSLEVDGAINATGDVTAYAASDAALKTNLERITNASEKVSQLNGYTFNWNTLAQKNETVREAGVIAQEVEKVLPEVVTTRKDGYMAVNYEKMVPLLIEAIKELKAEIDELKKG